jgi:hypothetical protein
MKNYLVKSLFRVGDPNWHVVDRRHEPDMYKHYLDMHEISTRSFLKYLTGEWELVLVEGPVDHINQAFEKTFWAIHDLWHREPCNILYTDPDTLAIKDIDIWHEYQKFMMFNYTDPRSLTTPNSYGLNFPNFFNAGVRYFPATMSEETWQVGVDIAKNWDYNTYDTEQIILNQMLWSQEITLEQALHPELNWIAMNLRNLDSKMVALHSGWNQCYLEQAKIMHFASSRGAEATKNFMQAISNT